MSDSICKEHEMRPWVRQTVRSTLVMQGRDLPIEYDALVSSCVNCQYEGERKLLHGDNSIRFLEASQ